MEEPVGVCVIELQLNFPPHSSLIPDSLVGFRPPYDSTGEMDWVMCLGLKFTLCWAKSGYSY